MATTERLDWFWHVLAAPHWRATPLTWFGALVFLAWLLVGCQARPVPEWPPHAEPRGYCADWRVF